MSSCTLLRREGTLFIFFKRNDNCIFLGIIPSFKLMVFPCRQTICFQQHLNELYSVNHHPTLPIGQQPVRDLKGHGMLRSTRRDCNRLPIFPLQNADIGRTSKNTDKMCESSLFTRGFTHFGSFRGKRMAPEPKLRCLYIFLFHFAPLIL